MKKKCIKTRGLLIERILGIMLFENYYACKQISQFNLIFWFMLDKISQFWYNAVHGKSQTLQRGGTNIRKLCSMYLPFYVSYSLLIYSFFYSRFRQNFLATSSQSNYRIKQTKIYSLIISLFNSRKLSKIPNICFCYSTIFFFFLLFSK